MRAPGGGGGGQQHLNAQLPEMTLRYALIEVSKVETVSDLLHVLAPVTAKPSSWTSRVSEHTDCGTPLQCWLSRSQIPLGK
jgi:hypothetical protein